MEKRRNKKVLIVDDESDICEVLKIEIESLGFIVTTARDGLHALEILKEVDPFVILSDINMPNMDGIELLKIIQKIKEPRPHVVLMTGFSGYEASELKARGAVDLIQKPLNLDDLESKLNCLVDERGLL